ncbi:unnamed protein product [Protopolystoma xenopodis]|uniref:Uncharacterized protein n=1 Tax=Protopolystoma xenopodis TaxID=117903 RepID=A0A448WLM0_9PLAT|nr:unnamed protein product [Protopolystoma xenopodis]
MDPPAIRPSAISNRATEQVPIRKSSAGLPAVFLPKPTFESPTAVPSEKTSSPPTKKSLDKTAIPHSKSALSQRHPSSASETQHPPMDTSAYLTLMLEQNAWVFNTNLDQLSAEMRLHLSHADQLALKALTCDEPQQLRNQLIRMAHKRVADFVAEQMRRVESRMLEEGMSPEDAMREAFQLGESLALQWNLLQHSLGVKVTRKLCIRDPRQIDRDNQIRATPRTKQIRAMSHYERFEDLFVGTNDLQPESSMSEMTTYEDNVQLELSSARQLKATQSKDSGARLYESRSPDGGTRDLIFGADEGLVGIHRTIYSFQDAKLLDIIIEHFARITRQTSAELACYRRVFEQILRHSDMANPNSQFASRLQNLKRRESKFFCLSYGSKASFRESPKPASVGSVFVDDEDNCLLEAFVELVIMSEAEQPEGSITGQIARIYRLEQCIRLLANQLYSYPVPGLVVASGIMDPLETLRQLTSTGRHDNSMSGPSGAASSTSMPASGEGILPQPSLGQLYMMIAKAYRMQREHKEPRQIRSSPRLSALVQPSVDTSLVTGVKMKIDGTGGSVGRRTKDQSEQDGSDLPGWPMTRERARKIECRLEQEFRDAQRPLSDAATCNYQTEDKFHKVNSGFQAVDPTIMYRKF